MKVLLIIAFVISTGSSFSATAKTLWACSTRPLTTSYILEDKGEGVRSLTVYHHNGVEFMPIHSGVITPRDLVTLKGYADLLVKLGERIQFEFEEKDCEVFGEWKMSCWSSQKKEVNGIEIRSAYLTTSTVKTEIFDSSFESIKVHLSINIGNKYYNIPAIYPKSDCRQN